MGRNGAKWGTVGVLGEKEDKWGELWREYAKRLRLLKVKFISYNELFRAE